MPLAELHILDSAINVPAMYCLNLTARHRNEVSQGNKKAERGTQKQDNSVKASRTALGTIVYEKNTPFTSLPVSVC